MANVEDEKPDFSELDLPADDMAGLDPLAEGAALEGPDAELPVLTADEFKRTEDTSKDKEAGLLGMLATAGPYSAMLGLSVLAILIGIICLWSELASYEHDMTKESIKAVVKAPAE